MQHNIQSGDCITTLPALRSKSKCIALPLMRRQALLRMLSNKHFWYKHLGVGNDTHRYAWLTTVHDKKQYRLSLYLMAAPIRDIDFYKAVFAYTPLSLKVLSLSTLAYYGMHCDNSAHRLLVINENEAYLACFGKNVFSHQNILSKNDHHNLFKDPYDETATDIAIQHLSESLQEQLRSERADTHTLGLASNLNTETKARLKSSLKDIALEPLNICQGLKLNQQLKNIPTSMSPTVALTRWLVKDKKIFKCEANFVHNYNTAYYLSAVCWILSTVISVALFFYYQHLRELNTGHHPQLQYQAQLSLQQNTYKKKIEQTNQHYEHQRQLHANLQFLSEQHRLAYELWSRLGELIPQSIQIESIDCQWQSACVITAKASDYGQIVHFADQLKQLDVISEVIINSSQTAQDQSTDTMQFTLSCVLHNKQTNDSE